MKNLLIICICILSLTACHHSAQSKRVNFIFFFDKINQDIVDEFEPRFLKGNNCFAQKQPEDFESLSFTIYSGSLENGTLITATFTSDGDKNLRYPSAEKFINLLKEAVGKNTGRCPLLSSIDQITDKLNDTLYENKIFMNSSMVENSGGLSDNRTNKDNWTSGNFNFSTPITGNGGNECSTPDVNEAIRQLGDSASWISRHLLNKKINSVAMSKTTLEISKIGEMPRRVNDGCDGVDIQNFWSELFSRLHLRSNNSGQSLQKYLSTELTIN